ncbi:MAG: hypothetical protein LBG72_04600 [Spirochaetaceae bacterium]|jgi:hypothetical protein|nr:hypothetical protein [Spirochaetaceae bacterium]
MVKRYFAAGGIFAAVAVLFSACKPAVNEFNMLPETKEFFATDLSTSPSKRYKIDAKLVAQGEKCIVYHELDEKNPIRMGIVNDLVYQFDKLIYPNITTAFGYPWKFDNEDRITLLLLDVQDGANGISGGYVAGYFYPNDLSNAMESNYLTMLYIDTLPGFNQIQTAYSTTAHELLHLINYSTSLRMARTPVETWLDEGLATAAEYLYKNEQQNARVRYFTSADNSIRNGNTFYVWANRNDLLAEYSSGYMFFQWLGIHSLNGYGIYKEIITSPFSDYRAVTTVVQKNMRVLFENETEAEEVWTKLLGTWFLANAIDEQNEYFGYKKRIDNLAIHKPQSTSVQLAPGEGVYSAPPESKPVNTDKLRYVFAGTKQQTAWHSLTGEEYQRYKEEGKLDLVAAFNTDTNIRGAEITANGIIPDAEVPPAANTSFRQTLYPVCPIGIINNLWQIK